MDFFVKEGWIQSHLEPKEFLKRFEERFREHADSNDILLHNPLSNEYLRLPYSYRGSKEYRDKLDNKLENLKDWIEMENKTLIHLRLSPRVDNYTSSLESYLKVRDIWNNLNNALTKKLKRKDNIEDNFEYFKVPEPTDKGHIHLHILIPTDRPYLVDKSWLDKYWYDHNLGDQAGVWIERIESRDKTGRKTLDYITKYLNKTTNNPYWSGLLRITRSKGYSCSKKVSLAMNTDHWVESFDNIGDLVDSLAIDFGRPTKTHSWEFVGAFDSSFLDWADYRNLDPPDLVDLYADTVRARNLEDPS